MIDTKNVNIVSIKQSVCTDWLLDKHYLKRMPTISKSFGLFINNHIEGVCVFSPAIARFDLEDSPYELSRLVTNELNQKNITSFFLAGCLNLIKDPHVVSYADQNWGHHGYIYQATNWMYTGMSSKEKIIYVNGEETHRRTIFARYGTSSIPALIGMGYTITFKEQEGKHRYFQVTGNKHQKKKLRKELMEKYDVLPYPKGQNSRYDAGDNIVRESYINKFF